MKASELRIGNWIHHKYSEPNFIVSVINTFNENTVNGIELDDCEPIPLTEEWLLKFGFENIGIDKRTLCDAYVKKGHRVVVSNSGNVYYRKLYVGAVHQLQNLYFALTNEELTL